MNEVFADTSGWATFFLEDEPHHEKSRLFIAQWKQKNRNIVTTNYVLSELIVLLGSRGQHRSAVLNNINRTYAFFREIGHNRPWSRGYKPLLQGDCVSPD